MTVRAVVLTILLATAASAAAASPPLPEITTDHARACRHYVNRAMFKPRGPRSELVVHLAESCVAAIRSLDPGDPAGPATAAAAIAYLDRLVAFKSLIIAINMERIYGANPDPRAMPIRAPDLSRVAGAARLGGAVSPTGEYLIAREVGLLTAYRAWMAEGRDFAGGQQRARERTQ